eukprot:gnl/MRDRNA2_/MRDRNA2_82812_c0_seq2.p1 gnl/MRDRNA2_/MRDRNA2_82812_c0~~gnl/MRDRNA2_/MRDRNA2_82812_c0_seq2.p1  ORF type:complete len:373 (+),score=49.87 gnl/MRDRNA2_/MRDRNA2_82812_c0_seq2:119-1237(+)
MSWWPLLQTDRHSLGASLSCGYWLRLATWLHLSTLARVSTLDGDRCHAQGSCHRKFNRMEDVYPTRQGKSEWIARVDPVVWNVSSEAGSPLSAEQLRIYERDGVLILPGVFSQAEIDAINKAIKDYAKSFDIGHEQKVTNTSTVVTETGTGVLRSLFAVHKLSASNLLRRLANERRLVAMAKQILGGEVYIFQSRVNPHQALKAAGFGWHSDFETWHAEDGMPRMRAFSIAVMLHEFTTSSGAIMVIPGSHKSFIASAAPSQDNMFTEKLQRSELERSPDKETMLKLIEESVDHRGIEHCVGPAGSVMLFDSNLMHASQKNMSPFDRSAFFIAFSGLENELVEPFSAASPRPEHLATRDPEFHAVPVVGLDL